MLLLALLPLPGLFCVFGAEAAERKEVVGVLGSSVLLDPEVKVDPDENEIVWMFSSGHKSLLTVVHHIPGHPVVEPSQHFKSRLQFVPSNCSLMVHRLEACDQGDYIFTVDVQEEKILELLLFEKLSKPFITSNSTIVDTDIELVCEVSVGIVSSITWMKDNEVIATDQNGFVQNKLFISKAKKSDCGIYSCSMENPVSKVNSCYTLHIHGFPPVQHSTLGLSIVALISGSAVFISIITSHLHEDSMAISLPFQRKMLLFGHFAAMTSLVILGVAIFCWTRTQGLSQITVATLVLLCLLLALIMLSICSMKSYNVELFNKILATKLWHVMLDVVTPLSGIIVICSSSILIIEIMKQAGRGCEAPANLQSIIIPAVLVPLVILVTVFATYAGYYAKHKQQERTWYSSYRQQKNLDQPVSIGKIQTLEMEQSELLSRKWSTG